jgi:hypothetical protein
MFGALVVYSQVDLRQYTVNSLHPKALNPLTSLSHCIVSSQSLSTYAIERGSIGDDLWTWGIRYQLSYCGRRGPFSNMVFRPEKIDDSVNQDSIIVPFSLQICIVGLPISSQCSSSGFAASPTS